MKIGLQTIIFAGEKCTLPEMLNAASSFGAQGIEFFHSPSKLFLERQDGRLVHPVNVIELASELRERNLSFLGLAGGSVRERVDFCLNYNPEIASEAGFQPSHLMPGYLYVEEIFSQDAEARMLRDCAYALKEGFQLGLHPHFYTAVERLSVVRDDPNYAAPGIKWLPDVAHLYLAGDDPVAELDAVPLSKLAAVHLKDWNEAYGRAHNTYAEGFCALGQGDVPIEKALDVLKRRQYNGFVIIEQDYPRISIDASITHSRRWLVERNYLSKESSERPIDYETHSAPVDYLPTLVGLYKSAKFTDIDPTNLAGHHEKLVSAVAKFFDAPFAGIWAWNSVRRKATYLASSCKPECLCGMTLLKLDDWLGEAIDHKSDVQFVCGEAGKGSHWQALAQEVGADCLTIAPIFQQHNPNQIRFIVAVFSHKPVQNVGEILKDLTNAASDSASKKKKDFVTGRVRFLANRSSGLQEFLAALRDLIKSQIPCEACSIFLENINREQLVPATPGTIWNESREHPAGHFYERSEADTYKTASAWIYGRTIFVQDRLAEGYSWKSREILPSEDRHKIQSDEIDRQVHDVLIVPIRAPIMNVSAEYAMSSVVGIVRIRNKGSSYANQFRTLFTDDDADCLTAICEAASPAIGPMLDYERQKVRLAIMTHEVSQPINVLNGMVDEITSIVKWTVKRMDEAANLRVETLLSDPEFNGQRADLIDYAEDALSWLSLIIRQVNLVSILGVDRLENVLKIEQKYLMADVIAPMKRQFLREIEKRKLNPNGLSYGDFGAVDKLYFDRNLMQQVFFNLISNGIKYAFQKQPDAFWIRIEAIDVGDYYRIDCKDNGAGVPEGYEELIFKEGYRSPGAIASGEAGLGLGLWLVKRIVEAHGGKVVLTRPHSPTVFSIYLPKSMKNMPPKRRALA